MKKIDRMIPRLESVLTGKRNLEQLYTFENFPVFFGCVDTPQEEDLVADMEWAIDPDTGVVQLTKVLPLDILYQEQHVDGCGPTWEQYYKDFAKYIADKNPTNVLEIGGGQGTIANLALDMLEGAKWTIIEPNPTNAASERIKVIKGFFDKDFRFEGKADTVTFSQLLEHIYDPREFFESLSDLLKEGDRLIFAYPNLALWLDRKYTNALNFEHTMLLTDVFIDSLLPKYGFKVLDKYFYNEHSIFYTAEKTMQKLNTPQLKNVYSEYKKLFLDFVNYYKGITTELNSRVDNAEKPVYLFGAHIFSEYLLNFGLKPNKIVSILDNSPTKQGRRLYGTGFIVDSPKVLKDKGKVNLILRAGIYTEEIKKDILENINPEVIFW